MIKLSVIIPVYNASRYIERCLQSVDSQTLGEIEVLLVDDHGTDESIAIAKRFAASSKRTDIQYRFAETPQNSGPGVARNIGLKLAQGEYVAFLDADDWVEPNMYEVLYTLAKTENADMSCCNASQDYEDGRASNILTHPAIAQGELTVVERKKLLAKYVAYLWTCAFCREWLVRNSVAFPDAKSAEDSSFVACCLLSARCVAQTDKVLYHYVMHEGSLTKRRVWKGADKRRAFRAMLDYAKRQGLMPEYRWQLYYVFLKKALLVPIIEML